MNPHEHLELFRDAILRSLKANRTTGMNRFTLEIALRMVGFPLATTADLEQEIQYLIDKGFIVEAAKSHTPANRRWRLTAVGVDDLEGRGL